MPTMPPHVRSAFRAELDRARAATSLDEKWLALERAHILSQQWVLPHVHAHGLMLALALRTRDGREILGQVYRLLGGGIVTALGRAPIGNDGRAATPSMRPAPLPDDLAAILAGAPAAPR